MATIKAGTYRFKDSISIPECYSINNVNWYIPWYYQIGGVEGDTPETTFLSYERVDEPAYFTDMYWPQDPDTGLHYSVTTLVDGESNVGRTVYTSENGWNETYETLLVWRNFYIDAGVPAENLGYPDIVKGWGQVIVVPTDTDVTDEQKAWLDVSWEEYVETTVAEVTYNGATLVTVNAGETKILKCAGLKMKTDVVIKM